MIRYQISSDNPAAHYFDIKLQIDSPDPDGQCLRMPAWIPGSYLIRDFAKNIVTLSARCGDATLAIRIGTLNLELDIKIMRGGIKAGNLVSNHQLETAKSQRRGV